MDPSNISHQGMESVSSLEEVLLASSTKAQQDKKTMKPPEESLKCPRCDSTNTKFCYYNNYSLSQPRYFCKGCKRYWTQGGTLRNVPVGGGCRKNTKRSSRSSSLSSSSSSSSSSKSTQDHQVLNIPNLPHFTYDSHNDLTLAFARLHNQQLGFNDQHNPLYRNCLSSPAAHFDDNNVIVGIPQNVYNGFGHKHMGEVLNGSGDHGEEAGWRYEEMNNSSTTTATTMTTTKQEFCGGRDGEMINKGYWNNFPWHIGAEAGLSLGGVDSGREYWNGLGSSWHGLVNSPLM